MARKVHCQAVGRINFGQRVLVRRGTAEKAGPNVANATALKPFWITGHRDGYSDAEHMLAEMDEGLGARDLHAIANGPIMDSNMLYLPAGKISEAEWRERQRQILMEEDHND